MPTHDEYMELKQLLFEKDCIESRIGELRAIIESEVEQNGAIDNELLTASMTKPYVSVSYDKKNVERAITMLHAYINAFAMNSTVKKPFEEVLTTLENGKSESQRSASLRIKFK